MRAIIFFAVAGCGQRTALASTSASVGNFSSAAAGALSGIATPNKSAQNRVISKLVDGSASATGHVPPSSPITAAAAIAARSST